MAKVSKAGRNDFCPCGSRKKFKKCCGRQRHQRTRTNTLLIVLAGCAIVGAIVFGLTSIGSEGTMTPAPGRVWSPEHGHWH
jgi:hypothetical protein